MRSTLLFIIMLQFLASCAPLPKVQEKNELLAYLPQAREQTLLADHLPVFLIEKQSNFYNKIGTPRVIFNGKREAVFFVDIGEATIYAEERKFKTANNGYTNLIYRVHFPRTPYSLFPLQIGAGKNVGLIAIVTLDGLNKPVLYTTVHTCGCYLAFFPTTNLPKDAYPFGWPEGNQAVYGETLPSLLNSRDKTIKESALVIFVRDSSHRIKDVWLSDRVGLDKYAHASAVMQPLASLEKLSIYGHDQTYSFYETSGKKTGYVKGSRKPLERLLISWWALDWNIGEDKKLSGEKNEPPVFFTSLKPWARDASDMRDFPTFLKYWGWQL